MPASEIASSLRVEVAHVVVCLACGAVRVMRGDLLNTSHVCTCGYVGWREAL